VENMSTVDLVVTGLQANRACRINFVEMLVYVYFVVIKRRESRVYEILHALRKRRSVERLDEF